MRPTPFSPRVLIVLACLALASAPAFAQQQDNSSGYDSSGNSDNSVTDSASGPELVGDGEPIFMDQTMNGVSTTGYSDDTVIDVTPAGSFSDQSQAPVNNDTASQMAETNRIMQQNASIAAGVREQKLLDEEKARNAQQGSPVHAGSTNGVPPAQVEYHSGIAGSSP